MQVIGIGCVCGGGGGEGGRKIIYISQNILSALIYISWLFGRRSIAVRRKKKNTAQHEPLFIAHTGEEGGMAAVEDILPCL